MEFVPPETCVCLAICFMPNLASGRCEKRRNLRFRSFYGISVDARVELWVLCGDDFDNLTMPVHVPWTLILLKQHITDEVNATRG